MLNKTIQQLYELARRTDFFFNFRGTVKGDYVIANIKFKDRTTALRMAMKLISQFKDEIDIILTDNNLSITAKNEQGGEQLC